MFWASPVLALAAVLVCGVSGTMTTLPELAELVTHQQGQHTAMAQEVRRLSTENQVLWQAAAQPPGLAEIAGAVGQAVQAAMGSATQVGATGPGRQSLIDIKGLGKPPVFKNDSSKFTEWLRKTTGFLTAAYGSSFRQ